MKLETFLENIRTFESKSYGEYDIITAVVENIQSVHSESVVTTGIKSPKNVARALLAMTGDDFQETFICGVDTEPLRNDEDRLFSSVDFDQMRYQEVRLNRSFVEKWL